MFSIVTDALIYIIYAASSSVGLYLIKIHKIGLDWRFILGFGLYLAGFCIWLNILKTYPLSVAFPIASSLLLISTQFVGFFFLGELISSNKLIGIAFILLGVFFVYKEIFHG